MIISEVGTPLVEPNDSIFLTTSIPSMTLPKTTCLPSNQGVASTVMKKDVPFVFGPRLAMPSRSIAISQSGSESQIVMRLDWKTLTQHSGSRMSQIEVLILESASERRFVVGRYFAALYHEARNDPIESGAFVRHSCGSGAQRTKVGHGFRDDIIGQLDYDTPNRFTGREGGVKKTFDDCD
jgi:hypothetical protein